MLKLAPLLFGFIALQYWHGIPPFKFIRGTLLAVRIGCNGGRCQLSR
ncbi:hypothetical protein AB6F62_16645 [Providencia huaxiensis]